MRELISRASIPGRVLDLLWSDDEFCRDVTSHKKVSSSGKFPKTDQWCDDEGFRMAFALAGYSPADVSISADGNMICINGSGNNPSSRDSEAGSEESGDIYPPKAPNTTVQQGVIMRGIARRNFRVKYFINPDFNIAESSAIMRNGLLEIFIPRAQIKEPVEINIKENIK